LTLLIAAVALAGCGTSFMRSASTGVFGSRDATNANSPGTAGVDAANAVPDYDCPEVNVRNGASTLMIGTKPGDGEPSALDLRYQGTIVRTARECKITGGTMTMKVGIEGRVITGPAGQPGTVDIPLRIAVVQEGVDPKPVLSKLVRLSATITSAVDRVTFTHVDSDIAFPMPRSAGDIDSYVVYVGFDPGVAVPAKKPVAKPKPAPRRAKPQG
jgi:hypothetical protein